MAKKLTKSLTKSLVPEGMDFDTWAANASVKDLVAEMQFGMNKLEKVLEKPKKKKKNA